MFDTLPPHSIEAEQAVIGALISDAYLFDRIAEFLAAGDFYDSGHALAFATLAGMVEHGETVDIVTLAEKLGQRQLDQIGGLPYLLRMTQICPVPSSLRRYAELVHENAQLRRLMGVFADASNACAKQNPQSSAEIASATELALMQSIDAAANEPKSLSGVFTDAIEYMEQAGTVSGLQSGFIDLDSATGGFEPGDLVILAARPSMGKTAFAVNILDNVVKSGKSAAFFSLEMATRQIGLRMLSSRSRIPVAAMRSGTMSNDQDRKSVV